MNEDTIVNYINSSSVDSVDIAGIDSMNISGIDSIWNEVAETYPPAFFVTHPQKYDEELSRTALPFDWFFAIICLYAALLAFMRLQVPAIFFLFQQTLLGKKQRDLFSTIDNSLKDFLYFLLLLCSWIGFSLALMEALTFFGFTFPIKPTIFAFGVILCYFSLKYLLKRIASWVFRTNKEFSEYFPLTVHTNFVWALIAFPLLIFNHYIVNQYFIWIICFIFGINFLQKFVLEWVIFSKRMKPLEVSLYLCTIEVLPFLLFARYVMNCFLI